MQCDNCRQSEGFRVSFFKCKTGAIVCSRCFPKKKSKLGFGSKKRRCEICNKEKKDHTKIK